MRCALMELLSLLGSFWLVSTLCTTALGLGLLFAGQ